MTLLPKRVPSLSTPLHLHGPSLHCPLPGPHAAPGPPASKRAHQVTPCPLLLLSHARISHVETPDSFSRAAKPHVMWLPHRSWTETPVAFRPAHQLPGTAQPSQLPPTRGPGPLSLHPHGAGSFLSQTAAQRLPSPRALLSTQPDSAVIGPHHTNSLRSADQYRIFLLVSCMLLDYLAFPTRRWGDSYEIGDFAVSFTATSSPPPVASMHE